jgi:UDPglucose--hexose-1-phosphate uridylyltransferase
MPTSRLDPRRGRLADGRAILYFDDAGGRDAGEPPADTRAPEARPADGELRHDALTDEWVIQAPHRQDRTHLPAASACPLCPSRAGSSTEIPANSYDVVVFENRFPSLPAAPPIGADGPRGGRCEVISYADDHDAQFASLPEGRLRTIAAAWTHREAELSASSDTAQVFIFENRGEEIGVTLHHPHGQIYAYPFVPPRAARLAEVATAHHRANNECLGCRLLQEEMKDGRRVIAEADVAVAFVPLAARWPYEVHVVPRRHVSTLAELDAEERLGLVHVQADVLARLDQLFGRRVPYMAGWYPIPRGIDSAAHHLRLSVVSPQREAAKLKYLAGSESLMGAFIGDVVPERAAERLRSVPGRT